MARKNKRRDILEVVMAANRQVGSDLKLHTCAAGRAYLQLWYQYFRAWNCFRKCVHVCNGERQYKLGIRWVWTSCMFVACSNKVQIIALCNNVGCTYLVKRWRRVSSITLFLISRRIIFAHLLGASPRDLWLLANVTQNGRQKDHVVLDHGKVILKLTLLGPVEENWRC